MKITMESPTDQTPISPYRIEPGQLAWVTAPGKGQFLALGIHEGFVRLDDPDQTWRSSARAQGADYQTADFYAVLLPAGTKITMESTV